MSKVTIDKSEVKKFTVPLDHFYEQYVIELPFHVPDGFYSSDRPDKFFMIRNNKLYQNIHDLNMQDETASYYDSDVFNWNKSLTIYLE